MPAASPDRSRFICLDHIHMRQPYRRLMAKSGCESSLACHSLRNNSFRLTLSSQEADAKVAGRRSAAECLSRYTVVLG